VPLAAGIGAARTGGVAEAVRCRLAQSAQPSMSMSPACRSAGPPESSSGRAETRSGPESTDMKWPIGPNTSVGWTWPIDRTSCSQRPITAIQAPDRRSPPDCRIADRRRLATTSPVTRPAMLDLAPELRILACGCEPGNGYEPPRAKLLIMHFAADCTGDGAGASLPLRDGKRRAGMTDRPAGTSVAYRMNGGRW